MHYKIKKPFHHLAWMERLLVIGACTLCGTQGRAIRFVRLGLSAVEILLHELGDALLIVGDVGT